MAKRLFLHRLQKYMTTALFLWMWIGAILPVQGMVRTKTIEREFPFVRDGRLILKIGNASIRVAGWDSAKIALKITEKVKSTSFVKAQKILESAQIVTQLKGKRFELTSHLPQGNFNLLDVFTSSFWKQKLQRMQAHFEMKIPRQSALKIKGEDQMAAIRGLSGEIEVTLDDGQIQIENCASSLLTVNTDNGNIDIRNIAAGKIGSSLLFSTGSGDLTVSGGNFQKIVGNTRSGDILMLGSRVQTIDISTTEGNFELVLQKVSSPAYRISSKLGNIFLYLPPRFSAQITAITDEGLLFANGDIPSGKKEKGASYQWMAGNGKGTVRLHTREGDIRLYTENSIERAL